RLLLGSRLGSASCWVRGRGRRGRWSVCWWSRRRAGSGWARSLSVWRGRWLGWSAVTRAFLRLRRRRLRLLLRGRWLGLGWHGRGECHEDRAQDNVAEQRAAQARAISVLQVGIL